MKLKRAVTAIGKRGFSLIELLVVMGLLGIVLAITTGNFITLARALKGESKIAETEVEKIVGLEILRQDIENAGYGLPWHVDTENWAALSGYTEAETQTVCDAVNITDYDDAPNNAPRAIISGNNACQDSSDYLVIKSTVVRNHQEAQKWTYIWNNGISNQVNSWATGADNIANSTRVIAINPKQNIQDNVLMTYPQGGGIAFYSQFSSVSTVYSPKPSEVYLLFGIGSDNTLDNTLRMPFNRADYYISKSDVPARCANGTGVLEKATLRHSNGQLSDYSPLLDCVADFQVVYGVDITNPIDGRIDCYTNDLTTPGITDAQNTRERIKEIRIYVLAHEGQMERDYRFGNSTVRVGDNSDNSGLNGCDSSGVDNVLGRDFDLTGITNWQNYRWKVYTLVVSPDNLMGR